LIAEMLTTHGFVVTTAADGAQARAQVAAALPELVILDMMLPEVSGFELLGEWRASLRTAGLPVFVLTSKDLSHNEQCYLRTHAEYSFANSSHGTKRWSSKSSAWWLRVWRRRW